MIVQIRQAVPHLERNIVRDQLFHRHPAAGIGAKQKRNFLIRCSLRDTGADPVRHILKLVLDGLIFPQRHRFPLPVTCLNGFRESLFIVGDQLSGLTHDGSAAPVINVQRNGFCIWIIFWKMEHDLRTCSSKTVDRLIVVSYYEQIVLRLRQHPDNVVLNRIDILKFVNENILKFFLPQGQDLRMFPEELITPDHDIVKIQFPAVPFPFFIGSVNGTEYLFRTGS